MNDDDGLALAIDVGGTTIKAELVDRAGTVVASEQRPTPQGHRARDAVAEVGRSLLAQRPDVPVVGAGVVVPGLVDSEAGIATYSANLGWRHLELVRSLGAEWRLPVRSPTTSPPAVWPSTGSARVSAQRTWRSCPSAQGSPLRSFPGGTW